jgi:PBP1b-binding outer membrane lipoprotein LpoB
MKRFGIWLIVAMFGLVLAGCSQEEKKAPAQSGAPPAKVEKAAPVAPSATPAPPPAQQPKPEHPKSEHPK